MSASGAIHHLDSLKTSNKTLLHCYQMYHTTAKVIDALKQNIKLSASCVNVHLALQLKRFHLKALRYCIYI